jgi:transposase
LLPRCSYPARRSTTEEEEPAMAKARTLVGLDVHATKIVAAVLDGETGELQMFGVGGDVGEPAALCAGLPGRCEPPTRPGRPATRWRVSSPGAAWSASWRRRARSPAQPAIASRPTVATPSTWCGCFWPASFTRSRVAGAEEEALRDLVGARDAVRQDLMRCRHRPSKLLLRHGHRFDDGPAWTRRHRDWLGAIVLPFAAAQATPTDHVGAIDALSGCSSRSIPRAARR